MSHNLILASSSPRRKELLQQVDIPFTVRKQNVDESVITTNDPREKVEKLAILKGRYTDIQHENEIILAADTVVSFQNRIFEKPADKEEAFQMLSSMSGKIHEVYTGVMLRTQMTEQVFVEKTLVEFWPLSDDEINRYIITGDPFDKAGAYGIQSGGAVLVKGIQGDYYNVVGLPVSRVVRELERIWGN
ncbi:Maf family protein [Virgibacillus siamensis]|uniref:Maf family protein n=1 Tax=Virgibacillus siamensis TaxID=480071 RepID=UPI000985B923|nr:Maf family protein [Virgibacillus siamensis]